MMNQDELLKNYKREKSKLNPEQRLAVETIEGPVMVLAGPGTGKTQVLAFRIAEILQRSDVAPRNILALTFTESGVAAMRERLVSLIGVAGYGVGIYTFHSFANRVINDSGAEFYKSHTLDPIDDIAQLKLIMTLIDASGDERIRPVRAPYFYVKPIMSTIKNLKNEGVTPEKLKLLCQDEMTRLEDSTESVSKSGKSKGNLKQSVKDTIEKLDRTIALSEIYSRYEAEMTERGLYDYEDMILFVLKSFHANSDLKAKYQEQFQYILVDEYQDTNSAQNTLVKMLSEYFDNPNLFVVGDDKQSIYRFQGASMANLLNFRDWYPAAQFISLKQNYRSGQIILNRADELIRQNKEQLAFVLPDVHTELTAQDPLGEVNFTDHHSPDHEALDILERIKTLLEQGITASHIAIIYRENSESELFTDLLTRQSIAFHLESGADVLKDSDTRQLLNLLELAYNPTNEMALFRYLHASYSGIDTSDLLAIGRLRRETRTNWVSLLESENPESSIKNWDQVSVIWSRIKEWHRYLSNHNLGDTVEHIFIDSGLLTSIMLQPNQIERLHRLRCFFEEVKHITNSIPFATLDDLFDRVAIRLTYNLPLVCPPLIEKSDNAIRLMTAHKSKGLEFEYVFIPHFHDGLWSNNQKHDLINLPPGIVPHHKVTEIETLEEERRLFYVALTRAKRAVFISSSEVDAGHKKILPAQFLSELNNVSILKPSNEVLPLQHFFSPVDALFITSASQAYLKQVVTEQSITPTGLNTFLVCPQEYLYKDVYCIPGVREVFQSYGTAVHKAMELWGNWSKDGRMVSLTDIVGIFREALIKEGLTEDEVKRYEKLGIEVLSGYYETKANDWIAPLATEYSFSPHNVLLDGEIPITGKFDKVEPIKRSKLVRVVDYKTGRAKSRNEIEGKTASADADYKRQLVFYAVLAEADPFFPYTIGEAALTFLDDHKRYTTEVFEISKQEKEELKELIRAVRSEMLLLHFDHTPHKNQFGKGESLCDLLRENRVVQSSVATIELKQEKLIP
jgi:DNA helicase-2/ATP-dependent DNA helicase PcrA